MLNATTISLSLEGEGRVRVFDIIAYSRPLNPLSSILSPPGRGGVDA
jgi:hypothetical protein